MRKLYLSVIGATALLAVTPLAAQENVTVRFLNFTAGADHAEDLQTIIDAFQAENPGITIQVDSAPFGDYFTLLQSDIISGDAPDVFEVNFENFITYAANGTMLDLGGLISEDAPYYPRALEAFQYEGQQFALPESFSTVLMYYNEDLFDQAGLEYPTDEWTWDDAVTAATAIDALGDDIYGLYSPIQYWEFYKKAAQNGECFFLNEDRTESTINSPACVETLQLMVDWLQDGVIPSQAQLSGISDSDLFSQGKIGIWITGIWMFSALRESEVNWNVQLEPMINQHAHHFFSNGVAVSSTTDVQDAAVRWVEFLTTSQVAAQVRIDNAWELPALDEPAYFESFLSQNPPENTQAVFQALESAVAPPTIERQVEMQDGVDRLISQVVDGELTAQEALDQAKALIDSLLTS